MTSGGIVARNGLNEGVPAANAQHGRGRGSRRRQLRNRVNLPKFTARYEPYPSARNRRVARKLLPSDWRNVPLPPYLKDFYREHTRTAQRSSEKAESFRNANEIIVTGRDAPILHVDEAGLPKSLTQTIENLNSDSSLTTLQAQCWPVVLSRRYLVAVDHAASMAYLVPALAQHQPSVLDDCGPTVVVLTLTRGVALQVQTAVQEFTKKSGIRTMCILCSKAKLLQQLKEGADICVAPSGRLTAFMKEGKVNLGRCTFLAVDEADRMLEMGFGRNRQEEASAGDGLRPDRLLKLTCATKESWELGQEFTNDPVSTAMREQHNQRVEHIVFVCDKVKKEDKLVGLLKDILRDDSDRAVIFVERQQTVEYLASILRIKGWPTVGIHGKKTEQEHEWALSALRSGKVSVLVTNDVATKAMELDNVRFVVSYDHPVHSSDYRRRFGHEIRPDATGRLYTFLAPDDHVRARELMRFFRENKQPLPPGLRKSSE